MSMSNAANISQIFLKQIERYSSLDLPDWTTCTTAMLSQCIRIAAWAQNLAQHLKAKRIWNISSCTIPNLKPKIEKTGVAYTLSDQMAPRPVKLASMNT